jgi:hypothetical protein
LGVTGAHSLTLVPLGVYSLNYPKMPLLLVDFRHRHHLRWHAVTQRAINEITAGVIGISHFTNWYYYVAADLYDFLASRRGAAMDQAKRLDCYSQFRVQLALDRQLDERLRLAMQDGVRSLAVNPLETAPQQEMNAAAQHAERLRQDAENGELAKFLDKHRRAELAASDAGGRQMLVDAFLHVVSFGRYTHRDESAPSETLAQVDRLRRAQYQLDFLSGLADQSSPPEILVDAGRIRQAIGELQDLMPQLRKRRICDQAVEVIEQLRMNSQDVELQADCSRVVASLHEWHEATDPAAPRPSVAAAAEATSSTLAIAGSPE